MTGDIQADRHRRDPSGDTSCHALRAISTDFWGDFALYCERCRGLGLRCLAEDLLLVVYHGSEADHS